METFTDRILVLLTFIPVAFRTARRTPHFPGHLFRWDCWSRQQSTFGRCRVIVIVLAVVGVETTMMTPGGRSSTCHTPTQTRCPATGSRQRGKRATLMAAATSIMLRGLSGVHVRWIPGTVNGGVHGAIAATTTRTRRADHIPPRGRWQHTSLWQSCDPPAADRGGRGQC